MFLRMVRLAMVLSILAVAIVTLLAARAYVHLPQQAEADIRALVGETLGAIAPEATYEIALVQQGHGDESYAEIWCARIKYIGLTEYSPETWTYVIAVKLTEWQSPYYTVGFVFKSFFNKVGCGVN